MSFVCDSEMCEMKVRMYRCTMWKSHQGFFNGTVELLCPITFLSEFTELKFEVKRAAETQRNSCHCECAVCVSAEKHACGEVFIKRQETLQSVLERPLTSALEQKHWRSTEGRPCVSKFRALYSAFASLSSAFIARLSSSPGPTFDS